jgi:hypothetical protein
MSIENMTEEERKANKERFLALVDRTDTSTMDRVRWRIRNRWWRRPLQRIQIRYYILKDFLFGLFK